MPFYKSGDPGSKNRWKSNLSAAMKRNSRTCPNCKRGAALGKKIEWPDGYARVCRYCKHEVVKTFY